MRKIVMDAEFIKETRVEIIPHNDGGVTIVYPQADFLVVDNSTGALYHTTFAGCGDDTLPCKEILCDQIQFLSQFQGGKP